MAQEQFTENTGISITPVYQSAVAWGDYDSDGDLDILLTGNTGSGNVSKIYRNDSGNSFTEQTSISLPGVSNGDVAWGDYDNDGFLDILLTGATGNSNISKVFKNNGDNTFTEQTAILMPGVNNSSVAWGDYNNDGYIDILLTGDTGSEKVSKVYKNNNDGTFSEDVALSMIGIDYSSVSWGDYDNDGYLDILLNGKGGPTMAKVYHNDSGNTSPNRPQLNLTQVKRGA